MDIRVIDLSQLVGIKGLDDAIRAELEREPRFAEALISSLTDRILTQHSSFVEGIHLLHQATRDMPNFPKTISKGSVRNLVRLALETSQELNELLSSDDPEDQRQQTEVRNKLADRRMEFEKKWHEEDNADLGVKS